jgi:hypothetical protein
MDTEFELDDSGNIKTQPVTGWKTAAIANMLVLLAIQYLDRPEGIETEKSLQLILKPQQCLELAETLTRQAKRVLDQPPSEKPVN